MRQSAPQTVRRGRPCKRCGRGIQTEQGWQAVEANSLLTAEPIEKIQLKSNCRAVYDADSRLLCGIDKRGIFDLNGKQIAAYDRTETREEMSKGENIKYEILHYLGENAAFRAENGYLHKDGERLGRIAPRDKRTIALIVALAFACLMFALSVLFTSMMGYAEETPPGDIYPTLTIRDNGGEWGAEGDIDIFGDSLLAPGSSGTYEFAIENPTQTRLRYTITLEVSRGEGLTPVPLEYELKMNNAAIAGGAGQGTLTVKDLLFEPESSHLFTLGWEWPAEGNDGQDTQVGAEGGDLTLTVTVTAQVAEG